jgi:hypothetical protein
MLMSVTPIVCTTLAFWLGRGRRSCAEAACERPKMVMTAKDKTTLRFA